MTAPLTPRRHGGWGRRILIAIPALWLLVFFLVPCLIVFKISLSQTVIAQPPYEPVLDIAAGLPGLRSFAAALSLDNYRMLGSDWIYLTSYVRSLAIATISTKSHRSCSPKTGASSIGPSFTTPQARTNPGR